MRTEHDLGPLPNRAPSPAEGGYADGFEPVARRFAAHLARGDEIGAGVAVYHRGRCVVDVYGGLADRRARAPWRRDTRVVLFSVTKGFAAMALHLLCDRGKISWDAPVTDYWPEFGAAGKEGITVGTLLSHRAGLPFLDASLSLTDCVTPEGCDRVRAALEAQRPAWRPGDEQGYHALTFGMYARELFERVSGGESMGTFLRRELFEPLGSDARLGTPAEDDGRFAALYPPSAGERLSKIAATAIVDPDAAEVRVARSLLHADSVARRAFTNPRGAGLLAYNEIPVRRAELAWASATASAHGVARAYLPFASGGEHAGRRYLRRETLASAHRRRSWSERDLVLQKPLGWTHGFLKEERHVFGPNPEAFGHAGMGGALGWCDPVDEITIGYVMNAMDWRVRSPRAVGLCHALYECEPLLGSRAR